MHSCKVGFIFTNDWDRVLSHEFGCCSKVQKMWTFQNKITVNYVIGDRVDTDIIFGNNMNAKSILVKSSIKNFMPSSLADQIFDDFNKFVSSVIK